MPDLEERLRTGLEQLAEPADPSGVLDRVAGRKARHRMVRRAEVAGLVVILVAGTAVGAIALSRAFLGRDEVRPATSLPGRIVFASDRNADRTAGDTENLYASDLYSMRPDGSDTVHLTRGPSDDRNPSVSPDGTRIAFLSNRPFGNPPHTYGLYVLGADGSGPRRLVEGPADTDSAPAWSPDGTRIVFAQAPEPHDCFPEKGDRCTPGVPSPGLIVVNADGAPDPRRLTDCPAKTCSADAQPAWSPDGSRIAFVRVDSGDLYNVFVTPASGGEATRLTPPSLLASQPAWSPDGSTLLVNAEGNGVLTQVSADGLQIKRVFRTDRVVFDASWSPDGKGIVLIQEVGGYERLFVALADGTHLRRITTGLFNDCCPSWSVAAPQVAPSPVEPSPTPRRIARSSNLCRSDQLFLETGSEGATGTGVIYATVHVRGGSACRLHLRVALTLTDVQGKVLRVDGNGSTTLLVGYLPQEYVAGSWLSRNWCGERLVRGQFTAPGIEASRDGVLVGRCDAPNAPSTLVVGRPLRQKAP